MNWLTRKPEVTNARRIPEMTLDELLIALVDYGQPKVGVYGSDGTWHCSIEMNTNTVGAEFKCRSDFHHESPRAAAVQCYERVLKAVEQYKKDRIE